MARLIKEWTALHAALTHSCYCGEHHSYNTLAQELFPPSVSRDIDGELVVGRQTFTDMDTCGPAATTSA